MSTGLYNVGVQIAATKILLGGISIGFTLTSSWRVGHVGISRC